MKPRPLASFLVSRTSIRVGPAGMTLRRFPDHATAGFRIVQPRCVALEPSFPGRPRAASARRWLALKALTRLRRESLFRRSGFLWTGATRQFDYASNLYDRSLTRKDAHWRSAARWLEAAQTFARPVLG